MGMCEIEIAKVEEEFRIVCKLFKTLTGRLASITRFIIITFLSRLPQSKAASKK